MIFKKSEKSVKIGEQKHIMERVSIFQNTVEVGWLEYYCQQNQAILSSIYIYPGFRENGYAQQLADHVKQELTANGMTIESDCWFFQKIT